MSSRTFVELVRLMRVAQVREQETQPKGLWPSMESTGMNKAYKALKKELEISVDEEIKKQQSGSGRTAGSASAFAKRSAPVKDQEECQHINVRYDDGHPEFKWVCLDCGTRANHIR